MRKLNKKIRKITNEFVDKCKERFGKDLISVVLFGSHARGTATSYSDVDLLVVVENLPKKRIERYKLLTKEIHDILIRYNLKISPIIIEPKELSTKNINPLIYGILTGYKILYERDDFWNRYLDNIRDVIKLTKPVYIEGAKRWDIEKLI